MNWSDAGRSSFSATAVNPPSTFTSEPVFGSAESVGVQHLKRANGVVMVPLYTDFKLHDICSGPNDPNREPLDQNQTAGSAAFFTGNQRFLTRRLWTVGSKPNYFHHGQFTIREAILNHFGEALETHKRFPRSARINKALSSSS